MNKNLITGVLAVAVVALFGYVLHLRKAIEVQSSGNSAHLVAARARAGQPDIPRSTENRTLSTTLSARRVKELPDSERGRLTGTGELDSASYFSCWITNASRWTVTELTFRIAAVEKHGMVRWERNYGERVQISPRRKAHVSFKVSDGRQAIAEWKIIGARGLPPD